MAVSLHHAPPRLAAGPLPLARLVAGPLPLARLAALAALASVARVGSRVDALCADARAADLRTLVLPLELDGSFRLSCDVP